MNGLRARQAELEAWIAAAQPDVLCLQEIKASPAQLGLLADVAGYHCYWHGEKGYSGVALLVSERVAPACPSFVVPPFDFESRIVTARLPGFAIASVYVPNGGKDYEAKLRFLGDLEAFAAAHTRDRVPLLICGDLNVARTDADIHPRERKLNQVGARPDERAQFERILSHDLVDVGRALNPDATDLFTWWPPWRNLRQKNVGWRIDYVLASGSLHARTASCVVEREVGTSDHAPVTWTST